MRIKTDRIQMCILIKKKHKYNPLYVNKNNTAMEN
jgi:hypothetical protein